MENGEWKRRDLKRKRSSFFNSCRIGRRLRGEELPTWALGPRPGLTLPSSTAQREGGVGGGGVRTDGERAPKPSTSSTATRCCLQLLQALTVFCSFNHAPTPYCARMSAV
ncbi:hypothetical protein Fmac_012622 [Flemingia macrophylla]|uniref:Uncharacterized protein n=1 Tax=Flemingia macrophylla TaxID=520843 RepID=A0ABD1MR88_9FABA